MEMEVAVEKNPRARTRAFAFSPAQSHEVDDDYSAASGDGGPDRGGGSGPSGLALKHKPPQMLKIAVIGNFGFTSILKCSGILGLVPS